MGDQVKDTMDLIMEEIKGLRDDTKANGERLARLVTQMYGLMGNGQPGRISLLEESVDSLKQWRWWIIGAAAGSGAVISVIAWVVEFQAKRWV
jgi:hypothetical protein